MFRKRTRGGGAAAVRNNDRQSQDAQSQNGNPSDDTGPLLRRLRQLTASQQQALLAGSPYLQDAMDNALSQWEQDERRLIEENRDQLPDRCICGRCEMNAAEGEDRCCGRNVDSCITLHPVFVQQILDREFLLLSMRHRNALWGTRDDGSQPKHFRHHAYKNFIFWQHGRLGPGVRIACFSCVYKKIRAAYPEPSGVYERFRDVEDLYNQLRYA